MSQNTSIIGSPNLLYPRYNVSIHRSANIFHTSIIKSIGLREKMQTIPKQSAFKTFSGFLIPKGIITQYESQDNTIYQSYTENRSNIDYLFNTLQSQCCSVNFSTGKEDSYKNCPQLLP